MSDNVKECTSTTCNIAIIFIAGLIYTTFMIDKCSLSNSFIETLSEEQRELYKQITHERKMIYVLGVLFGLVVSYIYMKIFPHQTTKLNTVCTITSITFLAAYFFYIFYPKKHAMILYLDDPRQREEWYAIYKKMQYHYHVGLGIGIVFVLFFSSC